MQGVVLMETVEIMICKITLVHHCPVYIKAPRFKLDWKYTSAGIQHLWEMTNKVVSIKK